MFKPKSDRGVEVLLERWASRRRLGVFGLNCSALLRARVKGEKSSAASVVVTSSKYQQLRVFGGWFWRRKSKKRKEEPKKKKRKKDEENAAKKRGVLVLAYSVSAKRFQGAAIGMAKTGSGGPVGVGRCLFGGFKKASSGRKE